MLLTVQAEDVEQRIAATADAEVRVDSFLYYLPYVNQYAGGEATGYLLPATPQT